MPSGSDVAPRKLAEAAVPFTDDAALALNVELGEVNRYDIWDGRECGVANGGAWAAAVAEYRASSAEFRSGIPLHLHQIWIGSRQPPCVWLDTWGIDFMSMFGSAAPCSLQPEKTKTSPTTSPNSWKYTLWDNASVKSMPMFNRDIFDREAAPQCQADILRLELLYRFGGVYVDADIVSTGRDLRAVVQGANDTGFMITYEPDTKDKPYSVLGNSIIAATPRHPLVLMLMKYIRKIYPLKRAHHGVEWVTGPLTYTKVLVHTGLPMTVPPTAEFYPAFHYVPNPSAIDLSAVDAYCFQFGYTCSGLSQWVAENNRCRNAHNCSYHSRVAYKLGKLRQFPVTIEEEEGTRKGGGGGGKNIPKIIHQFCLTDNPEDAPDRWCASWRDGFCPRFGFAYERWTLQRLRDEIGEFFCANLYDGIVGRGGKAATGLDRAVLELLAMEVVNARGGYYVPLSVVFRGDLCTSAELPWVVYEDDSDDDSDEDDENRNGYVYEYANGHDQELPSSTSIIGAQPDGCVRAIRQAYTAAANDRKKEAKGRGYASLSVRLTQPAAVLDMRFGDEVTALNAFPQKTRFLGATEIHAVLDARRGCARGVQAWGYASQVAVYLHEGDGEALRRALDAGWRASKARGEARYRAVVVLSEGFANVRDRMVDEIAGAIYHLDNDAENVDNNNNKNGPWEYMILNAEWECDRDGIETYVATCPFRAPNADYFGYVVNVATHGNGKTEEGKVKSRVDDVLGLFDSGRVHVLSVKSVHAHSLAATYSAMERIAAACAQLTDGRFQACFERGRDEVCNDGALFKGFHDNDQIAFEMQVDGRCAGNGGGGHEDGTWSMRSWSREHASINCECRLDMGTDMVEFLRVYDTHSGTVVHDMTNQRL